MMFRHARTAHLAGLVAMTAGVAVNLRPGTTTVGPQLATIVGHFGAGAGAAGLITAAPVMAFAVASFATPLIQARVSMRAGMCCALVLIAVSLAVRPWADLSVFVLATVTAAIGAGMLTALLPACIRALGNVRVLVATFTTALQCGAAIGFAAIVPLSRVLHSWQWALTLPSVLAVVGIIALWRCRVLPASTPASACAHRSFDPIRNLRRTKNVFLAIFFGLQALVAFVVIGWLPSILQDAGVNAQTAGSYMGVLTFLAIPISLLLPPVVARSGHPHWWLAGLSLFSVAGILGFLLSPTSAPLAWTLVLGTGLSVFSLALTVVTTRASSADQAVALSSAVQGVGYVIAAIGPYAIGVVREFASGWSIPLIALAVIAVFQTVVGLAVGGPQEPETGVSVAVPHQSRTHTWSAQPCVARRTGSDATGDRQSGSRWDHRPDTRDTRRDLSGHGDRQR
jgi:MFS transporter, CP family, cyanate transporter